MDQIRKEQKCVILFSSLSLQTLSKILQGIKAFKIKCFIFSVSCANIWSCRSANLTFPLHQVYHVLMTVLCQAQFQLCTHSKENYILYQNLIKYGKALTSDLNLAIHFVKHKTRKYGTENI